MTEDPPVRVSIIVPCRNEAAHIGAFLDSLLAQDMEGIPWEAIVADGMSDDGTGDILQAYSVRHPHLRVVANPGRIVSTGLNAAIRLARGDVILRMDAHTRYAPTYCRCCLKTLEWTGADNVGGPARTRAQGLSARTIAAAFHSRFSTGGARFHDVNYEGWVDTVPDGCWRKSTLERIGLFDESLVRNQDDELNLRLLRAGGKIWQSRDVVSWYSPRASWTNLFRQYLQYGFWKVGAMRKHGLPRSWRHLAPAAFLLANVLLIGAMAVTAAAPDSRRFTTAASLWLAFMAVYFGACLFASVLAARRHGWATLAFLPATFAVYHVSYGLGFLAGLFWFMSGLDGAPYRKSAFTSITR